MSPTSYQTAPPRINEKEYIFYLENCQEVYAIIIIYFKALINSSVERVAVPTFPTTIPAAQFAAIALF